jgi:fibronectin-binding autotransporter adhesin
MHLRLLAFLLTLTAPSALLAQSIWNGTTPDLSDPNNWNPDVLPSATASTQILFDGSSAQNILTFNGGTFSGNPGLGTITIASTQTAPLTITNAGAANSVFRVANSTDLIIQPGAGAVTFGGGGNSFFYNLGSAGVGNQFINNSSNLATFGANVSINASGGSGALAIFDGSGNWLISGPITNAATRGVIKNGTGTLTLNGNNAYAGPTLINAGTVILGNDNALGTSAQGTTIATGATLNINARNIQGEAITTAGTITNTGGEQQNALRTVTLSGNATFTGTGRFDVRGTSDPLVGLLDLAGHTLTKTGSNLVFIVDSTITPGTINVTSGTLGLSRSNWASGTVNLSGGILRFDNNTVSTPAYGANINFSGGTLNLQGGSATVSGNLALSGAGSRSIDTATGHTLTITGTLSGSTGFTKIGGGTLNLVGSGNGAMGSGTITLNTGTLALRNDGAGNDGLISYGNTFLTNSGNNVTIHVASAGTSTGNTIAIANSDYNLGNSTLNVTGEDGYNLRINAFRTAGGGAGTAVLNPTTANLLIGTFANANASRTLNLSGTSQGNVIEGNMANGAGTVTVNKTGTSTWQLAGTNTYTGTTTVSAGTLELTGIIQNSPVIVLPNGRFSGTGTVNSSLSIQGGTLAPGSQALFGLGTLTLNGNLSFASTWEVSIDGPDASLLQHNGTFLGSLDDITLAAGTTFNPVLDLPVQIYAGTSTPSGLFDNFTPTSGFGGATGTGTLDGTTFAAFIGSVLSQGNIVTGNGIVLVAIPEPSRPLLLAAALTPLFLRRRRR